MSEIRSAALALAIVALAFTIVPQVAPTHTSSTDTFFGSFVADAYTWGLEIQGDSESWFDADGSDDGVKELRGAMISFYIGAGMIVAAILLIATRSQFSGGVMLFGGLLLLVAQILTSVGINAMDAGFEAQAGYFLAWGAVGLSIASGGILLGK
ncbi:MAG: hypothetical protein ACPHK8_07345 [Thermoplasmatota archaeon]